VRRRDFLKYSAGLVALSAAGGVTRLATAQPPPLDVIETFDYRGRHVVIVRLDSDRIGIVLDGRTLSPGALLRVGDGRFSSALLPFQAQPSRRSLASSLIDNDGRLFIL
jgi:hypothetical protein